MATRGRTTLTLCATVVVSLLLLASPSDGQILGGTTTTTAPPSTSTTALLGGATTSTTTTTTTPPSSGGQERPVAPDDGSTPPPPGSGDQDGGDGTAPPPGASRSIPVEAQRVMNSVDRTPANSSADLLAAVEQLVDLGLSREEAIRVGFGRFPVAGAARYSHDWLYPRWGPGFRFHLGTDVFAPYGTPLRAPVDGTVRSSNNSLGGLAVKIVMDDGTYFYFAHMSGLVEGFSEGMAVQTGDIVGYVGDSGNAKGTPPHLHIGVYPQGGEATDPKPILDRFLAEAHARLPEIIEQVKANPPAPAQAAPEAAPDRTPRSLLATSLLRPLTERNAAGAVPTEVLYQTTGNPSAGGVSVAQTEAEHLAASIDWEDWASSSATKRQMLRQAEDAFRAAFGFGDRDRQASAASGSG